VIVTSVALLTARVETLTLLDKVDPVAVITPATDDVFAAIVTVASVIEVTNR
jgi:hypothetical protein